MSSPTDERRRWLALVVLCSGTLAIALDATVVNVALPNIQDDLGLSAASLAWVVNAYLISFGGLLLLAGGIGDRLGRRTCFLLGMGLFVGASLVCGLAQSKVILIGGRFLQGAGGAMTAAVALGIIVSLFSDPREQARAIGAFAFVAAAGGAIGLLAGGVLTQLLDWHWIFLVNLPVGMLVIALTTRLVDRDVGTGAGGTLDVAGGALITAAFMVGVSAIVGPAASRGWTDPRTLIVALVAIALLGAFFAREATARTPLLAPGVLRMPNVAAANLVQLLAVAGMFGMFFLGALYFERILGYSALQIGLAFLPVIVMIGVTSIGFSERVIGRLGARATVVVGLVAMAAGLAYFARSPLDGHFAVDILPVTVLVGGGAGLCFPAVMGLAMSAATDADAGVISGVVGTTAQVGGALGLAVLATLSTSRTGTLRAGGVGTDQALLSGYHLAFWIAAGLVAGGILIALLGLSSSQASSRSHPHRPRMHVSGVAFVVPASPSGSAGSR